MHAIENNPSGIQVIIKVKLLGYKPLITTILYKFVVKLYLYDKLRA